MKLTPALSLIPLVLTLGGCASSAATRAPAAPAQAPAPAAETSAPGELQYAQPPPSAVDDSAQESTPEAPAAPEPALPSPGGEANGELAAWLGAFESAELRLGSGLADCVRACQALESMRRATARICRLDPPPGSGRCDQAHARLDRAERQVRSSCGQCSD